MKKVVLRVEENLLSEALKVIKPTGFDIQTAIRLFLMRLVKERDLSFILSNSQSNEEDEKVSKTNSIQTRAQVDLEHMTKSRASSLLRNNGIKLNRNVTFASKNRTAYNYWANPSFEMLKDEWYIILNDWLKREIILLKIPEGSISEADLVPRSDKRYLMDLQIMYNDNTFTDTRSGFSFGQYLVKVLKY